MKPIQSQVSTVIGTVAIRLGEDEGVSACSDTPLPFLSAVAKLSKISNLEISFEIALHRRETVRHQMNWSDQADTVEDGLAHRL